MNLLIITQKVDDNDDILGFFTRWLLEFAKNYEKITVICLQKGEYDLPENIKVFSLGKDKGVSKIKYLKNFYKYIWQERKNYDKVFVHMNPIYVVLGGLFWRFKGKKVALWYTHKSVDLKLRIAEKLANIIFTASYESFQLKSKKVEVVGHGIDVNKFICNENIDKKNDLIYVGRLDKIKNQKLLVGAIDILVKELGKKEIKVNLVGDFNSKYGAELKEIVKEKKLENNIKFSGSIPNKDIVGYYCNSKISINLCPTGGMDKAVLESMSCGIPVVVLNKTFESLLSSEMILEKNDPKELADKILNLLENKKDFDLRRIILENYSLDSLIKKICSKM